MARSPYVVDVPGSEPEDFASALEPHAGRARRLIAAFDQQAEETITDALGTILGAAAWGTLKVGVGGLHRLFRRQFGDEIDALSEALGVDATDLVVANIAYDLVAGVGCTTMALSGSDGPLHARNLDWTFPGGLLRKNTTILNVDGPRGPYSMVGWPGMFGALTATAPGRFSVSVNFVRHEDYLSPVDLGKRAVAGYWPVSWVVRQVLETAKTFDTAVRQLSSANILASVMFMVVGTKNSERVVVERSPDEYAHRKARGPLLLTNHYASPEFESENVDLSEMDTEDRYCRTEELLEDDIPKTCKAAIKLLGDGDLLSDITQHQVAMRPAAGEMMVRVPGHKAVSISE